MKSSYRHYIAMALTLFTLTGCHNRDVEPDVNLRKDCPDFTATIGGVKTRAYDRVWEQGDKIGITGAGRTNICYKTENGDGSFLVDRQGEQIYFQDESEVIFTAYYPWSTLIGETKTVTADTREQTGQKNFDFLWAQGSGKKDAPVVSFTFAHKMAKVLFTVKPGDGMSYDEVKNAQLSLSGFCHTGSFDISDGHTDVDNESAASNWIFTGGVAPADFEENEKTVTFTLLFFPQLFDNLTPFKFSADLSLADGKSYNLMAEIDFTAANRKTDGADAKNEWVAGRQYDLSLTLHKTEISIDQCEITPWTVVEGEEIIVD